MDIEGANKGFKKCWYAHCGWKNTSNTSTKMGQNKFKNV
jgi:hypothetical protein